MQLSFDFAERQPGPPPVLDRAYDAARRWSRDLADELGEPIRLVVTDNRRTMLSAQHKGGRLEIRLHHMFLQADPHIFDAVVGYLGGKDRHAHKKIDAFVEENHDRVVASARRRTQIQTRGEHFDLQVIFDSLETRYFETPVEARITWGRRVVPNKRQRSLQLGNYVPDEQLIRVHPVLDQSWVPLYVIEAVVYHEMLHHMMPAVVRNGRHHYHTPTFLARERQYEHFAKAEAWEKANFWRLLRGR